MNYFDGKMQRLMCRRVSSFTISGIFSSRVSCLYSTRAVKQSSKRIHAFVPQTLQVRSVRILSIPNLVSDVTSAMKEERQVEGELLVIREVSQAALEGFLCRRLTIPSTTEVRIHVQKDLYLNSLPASKTVSCPILRHAPPNNRWVWPRRSSMKSARHSLQKIELLVITEGTQADVFIGRRRSFRSAYDGITAQARLNVLSRRVPVSRID